MSPARLVALCGALAIVATGCGATTVDVTLSEWAVSPSTTSVEAGGIRFEVWSEGLHTHELVVLKTELGVTELPVDEIGAVDEQGEGIEVMGKVEGVAPNYTPAIGLMPPPPHITLDLEAGSYVLICNIVDFGDDEELEAHYQLGMRTGFTVT